MRKDFSFNLFGEKNELTLIIYSRVQSPVSLLLTETCCAAYLLNGGGQGVSFASADRKRL